MVQSIKERFTDLEKHPATAYTGNTKTPTEGTGEWREVRARSELVVRSSGLQHHQTSTGRQR